MNKRATLGVVIRIENENKMSYIDSQKWRYATKKYDTAKVVSDSDINTIKEAINLAATSYGLQLFSVLDIKDKAVREQLKEVSWGQAQITDASHLFVLCNFTEYKEIDIESYLALKAKANNLDVALLSGYGDFMKGTISQFPQENFQAWTAKQTYIALGNGLSACADLKIDSTPIEGFDVSKYNEILGLTEKGLNASVVLSIGYRADDDNSQHEVKTRKSIEDLFIEV